MARERVYAHSDPMWRDRDATDESVEVRPGVEITFHHDGDSVGVATGHLTDATYDDTDKTMNVVTTPYHVSLGRAEVNKLIRDLRRARNVAFGVDE